jgi:HEAT repeat protein
MLDDVKAALADSDWQVRLSVLEKLADRKDHATIDLLISIAEDRSEYWKVQIKAIQLLGEAADERSIAFLTYILNSNTGDWRCPAFTLILQQPSVTSEKTGARSRPLSMGSRMRNSLPGKHQL